MTCLFKFCFLDVPLSLQRTKNFRGEKMTYFRFLQLGLHVSKELGVGAFPKASHSWGWEEGRLLEAPGGI